MWIHGSTLSISQRSLSPEHPLSPRQQRAQELATQLIQSYHARHIIEQALEFVGENSVSEISWEGDYACIRPEHAHLKTLEIPNEYGVKGGAAREALVATLNIRESQQPRDVDLVRRGHHRLSTDDDIARRIMGRDFELGARVELIRNLGGYLSSRDLSINEVVLIDGTIYASLTCLLDTIGLVVRPSRYRSGSLHRKPSLHGQTLLKMSRLYAEGICRGENWCVTGIPEEISFSEFDLAVHLNKAFQRGRAVADAFLHTCEILSLISASDDRVRNALEELEHLRHGERGLFPDVPEQEWRGVTDTD